MTPIRILFIVIAAIAVPLVGAVLASRFLPGRARIYLYLGLLSLGLGVLAFFAYNRYLLPTGLALEPYATGLRQPVYAVPAPDGSGRFFVVEREGTVRIVGSDGAPQEPPFLDLTGRVALNRDEQGLLGLAFHPEYEQNGFFYVYSTTPVDDSVLVRYRASRDNPARADADSAAVMLTFEQPFDNHNGGLLIFGPDGYLYLGLGDGGNGEGVRNEAQDRSNMLGSIIRLDVSDPDSEPPYYAIPPDNPFLDEEDVRPEIWAYGLRNPWRFTFAPETNDVFIADVGWNTREEVNFVAAEEAAGSNYGWRDFEGTIRSDGWGDGVTQGKVFPVAEYDHNALGGCAVIGGYVYRGQAIPGLAGKYLYADSCTGFVWALGQTEPGTWVSERVLSTNLFLSSFAEDEEGELYLLAFGEGTIYKIVPK